MTTQRSSVRKSIPRRHRNFSSTKASTGPELLKIYRPFSYQKFTRYMWRSRWRCPRRRRPGSTLSPSRLCSQLSLMIITRRRGAAYTSTITLLNNVEALSSPMRAAARVKNVLLRSIASLLRSACPHRRKRARIPLRPQLSWRNPL